MIDVVEILVSKCSSIFTEYNYSDRQILAMRGKEKSVYLSHSNNHGSQTVTREEIRSVSLLTTVAPHHTSGPLWTSQGDNCALNLIIHFESKLFRWKYI